jgi:hypothetical protein
MADTFIAYAAAKVPIIKKAPKPVEPVTSDKDVVIGTRGGHPVTNQHAATINMEAGHYPFPVERPSTVVNGSEAQKLAPSHRPPTHTDSTIGVVFHAQVPIEKPQQGTIRNEGVYFSHGSQMPAQGDTVLATNAGAMSSEGAQLLGKNATMNGSNDTVLGGTAKSEGEVVLEHRVPGKLTRT